jgi:two-component system sensor histidine kinase QseC
MARRSLRRRLLALILGLSAAAWIGVAAYAYLEARHEAEELLDAHLAQSAALLLAQAGDDLDEDESDHVRALHRLTRKTAFQVWERGTRLRLHSANAPNERFSAVEVGFSDAQHEGRAWRVFSTWDRRRRVLVQVAEHREARADIVAALGAALAWPLAVALPLLAGGIWLALGQGLAPLRELRAQLARRSASDLQPLDTARAPEEVEPLVAELNRLFARIGETVARERRLTADAAHELRTPLAVLSTQAQVARRATGDAQRNEALDALIAGAERAARLIEQMLTLARLEAGKPAEPVQRVALQEIAREALAEAAPRAVEKNVDVSLENGAPAEVQGHAALLAILLRNLVDNAVRYTPAGGRVRVSARALPEGAELEVADDGPGVASAELPRLGERFHRLAGAAETGSGLGLSIVLRIAELHGARVRFAPGLGGAGLSVSLRFPSPAGRPGADATGSGSRRS